MNEGYMDVLRSIASSEPTPGELGRSALLGSRTLIVVDGSEIDIGEGEVGKGTMPQRLP